MSTRMRLTSVGSLPSSLRPTTEQTSTQRNCTCFAATLSSVIAIIAVFGLTSYNMLHNKYTKNHLEFHTGDEVAVSSFSNDLSGKFCSEYEVRTYDPSSVYLLPSTASVNSTYHKLQRFQLLATGHVPFNLDYRAFYLLRNSIIESLGCHLSSIERQEPAEIIILKGERSIYHWHPESHNKAEARAIIPTEVSCNGSAQNYTKLQYTVTADDTYYIILFEKSRWHQRQNGAFLNGTISRTSYVTSNAISWCLDRTLCRFELDFSAGNLDVIIRTDNWNLLSKSILTTQCQPRVIFWVGIFGAIPLFLIAVIVFFWIWLFCVCLPARQRKQESFRSASAMSNDTDVFTEAENAILIRNGTLPATTNDGYVTVQRGDL